jgi:hypothetical protein
MDFNSVLAQLRQERDLLDQVILALEALAQGRKRGRGRPPGRMTDSARSIPPIRANGNGHMSGTTRDVQ